MKRFAVIILFLCFCGMLAGAGKNKRIIIPRFPAGKTAILCDDPAVCKAFLTLFGKEKCLFCKDGRLPAGADGVIVMLKTQELPSGLRETLEKFPGKVLLDLRNFAALFQLPLEQKPAGRKQVWKLRKESELFAAVRIGRVPVRCSAKGETAAIACAELAKTGAEALVTDSAEKYASAVRKGNLFACELLALPEPHVQQVGSFYKYLPATDLFGNRCRFGVYHPKRLSYDDVGAWMRSLAQKYPALKYAEHGKTSNGKPLYSFTIGTPGKPLYFFYSSVHGGEWEPGYGLIDFAERLARGDYKDKVDLTRCQFLLIPSLNPYGYEKICRKNANLVDINRQTDLHWETYERDNNKDGKYDQKDNAWKGSAPWSEPEAKIFKELVDSRSKELFCILDLHGNHEMLNNLLLLLPETARQENRSCAQKLRNQVDSALAGRYYLQQTGRSAKRPIRYLFRGEPQLSSRPAPNLKDYAGKGRYGFLVELCCYFRHCEGTLIATDVTGEVIDALLDIVKPQEQ